MVLTGKQETVLAVLSTRMGRKEVDWLRDMLIEDKRLFEYCFELIQLEEKKIAWHAAWVIDKVSEQAPSLFTDKHTKQLENFSLVNNHTGLQRLVLSTLLNLPLHQPISVEFINRNFEQMVSPKEPVGVQTLAMKMLEKICETEPAFIPELIFTLENTGEGFYSKGFYTCRRNTINKLKKRR